MIILENYLESSFHTHEWLKIILIIVILVLILKVCLTKVKILMIMNNYKIAIKATRRRQ